MRRDAVPRRVSQEEREVSLVGFPAFPFPSPFGSNKQNNYIWFLRKKIIYWWLRKFLNRAKDSSVGSQVVPLFKLILDLIMLILEVHCRQLDQNISKEWIFSNKQNNLKNFRKSKFFLCSFIVNYRKFQNTINLIFLPVICDDIAFIYDFLLKWKTLHKLCYLNV